MAVEPSQLKARARRAYELGRVRVALIGALPVAIIAIMAGLADGVWTPIYWAGPPLVVAAAVLQWRGGHYGRAVLPGVAAGVVPFVAMHVARVSGHDCAGPACYSVCVPACVIGGALAGVIIASMAKRSSAPLVSWVAGGVVAALTGALGCACVGTFGVLGLVVGLVLASLPLVIRPIVADGR